MQPLKGLTSEKTRTIISEMQERRLLWDRSDVDYKDMALKEEAWNSLAASVELPVERLKKIWINLRDTHTRYHREDKKRGTSSSPSKHSKLAAWKWAKPLDFLTTNEHSTFGSYDVSDSHFPKLEPEDDESAGDGGGATVATPTSVMFLQGSVPSQPMDEHCVSAMSKDFFGPQDTEGIDTFMNIPSSRKRKKTDWNNDELEQRCCPCLEKGHVEPDLEADRLWLLSLLPNFRGRTLHQKNTLKYKIQGLLLESEQENTETWYNDCP